MVYALRSILRSDPSPRAALSRTFGSEPVPAWFGVRLGHSSPPSRSESARTNMDRGDPVHKNEDVMWTDFGETYATRSEEEGFGGIYGQKQTVLVKEEETVEDRTASEVGKMTEVKEDRVGQKIQQPNT